MDKYMFEESSDITCTALSRENEKKSKRLHIEQEMDISVSLYKNEILENDVDRISSLWESFR